MIYVISAHTGNGTKPRTSRTFGYYETEKAARDAISMDIGGMHECLYMWLVIEEVPPGIHAEARVIQWFSWGSPGKFSGWTPCEAPNWATGVVNFGIG